MFCKHGFTVIVTELTNREQRAGLEVGENVGYRGGLGDSSEGDTSGVCTCHVASIWEFNGNAFVDGCHV